MANGKVASYRMEIRMAIADAMVNGRDYGEIREYLAGCGMEAGELPSDHSLRTFEESVEYRTVYQDRVDACNLQLQAGRIAGCASTRVTLIQERILRTWETWMDAGAMDAADMYKVFSLTLQYKRQELAERRLALQEGQPMLREPLGPQEFSAEKLDAIMDRLAAERAAAEAEEVAAAEQRVAADAKVGDVVEAAGCMSIPQDGVASASISEVSAGSRRISEEDGGSRSIPQEVGTSARNLEENAGSWSIPEDQGASVCIPGEDAGSQRMQEEDGDDRSILEHSAGYRRIPQDGVGSTGIPEGETVGSRRILEHSAGYRRIPQDAVG